MADKQQAPLQQDADTTQLDKLTRQQLDKGRFTAAVTAQNGNKTAFFDCEIQILKYGDAGRVIHARIMKRQMFNRNSSTQNCVPLNIRVSTFLWSRRAA